MHRFGLNHRDIRLLCRRTHFITASYTDQHKILHVHFRAYPPGSERHPAVEHMGVKSKFRIFSLQNHLYYIICAQMAMLSRRKLESSEKVERDGRARVPDLRKSPTHILVGRASSPVKWLFQRPRLKKVWVLVFWMVTSREHESQIA